MKKTKIIISLLAISFMLFSSVLVYAQQSESSREPSPDELMKKAEANKDKSVLVADVWVGNAMMKAGQDKNKSEISFDIHNRLETQTGVKYGLQLRKKGKPNDILDQKSYDEILTLGAQEKRSIIVEYEIPYYAAGELELMVYCVQENGLVLGVNKVADLILSGRNEYIELKDCKLTIDGDNTDTKYDLGYGVDIAQNENISVTCNAKNNFKQQISVNTVFDIHYRHPFGKLLSTKKEENIIFNAGEEKQINLSIPKETRPQAYDIQLTLQNDKNEIISSRLYIHYVIQGVSGTIQNLRLNKDSFTAGEMALAYFFWTDANDNFSGSRDGGTKYNKANIELTLVDASGKACSDPVKKEVANNSMEQVKVEIPIKNNCTDNPFVTAVLKDTNGNVLDNFSAKIGQPTEKSVIKTGKNSAYLLILIAAIPILIATILVYLRKKKRKISSINIFPLVMILSIGMTYCPQTEAATFYAVGENITTFTTTMDRFYYGVNDTITVYGTGTTGCNNSHTMQLWGAPAGHGNQYFWHTYDDGKWWTQNASGSALWAGPHPKGYQTAFWGGSDLALNAYGYGQDNYFVQDVPQVSMGFIRNPIDYGTTARIAVWSAEAEWCRIWGGGFDNTPISPNGYYEFDNWALLYSPTTFDFVCGNWAGTNYSRKTVSVNPPPCTPDTTCASHAVTFWGTCSATACGTPGTITGTCDNGCGGTGYVSQPCSAPACCACDATENANYCSSYINSCGALCSGTKVPDTNCTSHAITWGSCAGSCGTTGTRTGTCDNGCGGTGSISGTCTTLPCCLCNPSEEASRCSIERWNDSCGNINVCNGKKDCTDKDWKEVAPH